MIFRLAPLLVLLLALPIRAQPVILPIEARLVADGFRFVEGPVWNPRGFFLFSDIPADTLFKATPKGKVAVVRQPTGKSNGNAYDAQNRFLSCEHQTRRLARKERDQVFRTLADRFEGKRLNSPNDLALFSDGSIFFSDPTYGGAPKSELELDFRGLYRWHPERDLELLDRDWQQPNGLCFSPDFKRFYVGDSQAGQIFRFDVSESGALSNKTLLDTIPKPGDPDGMKCDSSGRLFVSGPGGVRVYSPEGQLLGLIATPKHASNVAFGGADGKQLFITARDSVYLADVSGF